MREGELLDHFPVQDRLSLLEYYSSVASSQNRTSLCLHDGGDFLVGFRIGSRAYTMPLIEEVRCMLFIAFFDPNGGRGQGRVN